jgi:riboflavin kinase, archaea type
MELKGVIVSGTKKGAYFMSQAVYRSQFEDKLNFKPYIGTLNVQVGKEDVEKVKKLLETDIPKIKGKDFFGDVKFKKAVLNDKVEGAVIFPEKTRHSMDVIEFIAPQSIKGTYNMDDGDSVTITIED